MSKNLFGVSPTSKVLRCKLMSSISSGGDGLTGLAYNTANLRISAIKIGEATPTVYTAGSTTIETITTLGTYAAPTATKCRFREVDATNNPGVYEIHFADARFASTDSLLVSIGGAANLAQADFEVECKNIAAESVLLGSQAQTDVRSAMTNQGYTTTRAGYLDTLNGLVSAIWANATRTLSSFGTLAADVWASATRTLSSVSGLTIAANITQIDGQATNGNNATLKLKQLSIVNGDSFVDNTDTGKAVVLRTSHATRPGNVVDISSPWDRTQDRTLYGEGISIFTKSYGMYINTQYQGILMQCNSTCLHLESEAAPAAYLASNDSLNHSAAVHIITQQGDGLKVVGGTTYKDIAAKEIGSGFAGTVNANITQINGQLTSGNNATLYLKQLNIQNSDAANLMDNGVLGSAVVIKASHPSQSGMGLFIAAPGPSVLHNRSYGKAVYVQGSSVGLNVVSTADDAVTFETSNTGSKAFNVIAQNGHALYCESGSAYNDIHAKEIGVGFSGIVQANLVQIDGQDTDGNNATLNLKKLSIINGDNGGVALHLEQTNANNGNSVQIISNAAFGTSLLINKNVASTHGAIELNDDIQIGNGFVDAKLIEIMGKTSNLPSDPASNSEVLAAVGTVLSDVGNVQDNVTTIVEKLPTGTISSFNINGDTVDGVSYSTIMEFIMCVFNGRFRKDYPNTGDITFYKRNNVDVLSVVHVTADERSREV